MRNVLKIAATAAVIGLPLVAVGQGTITIVSPPNNITNITQLLDKVCQVINLIFTVLLIVAVIFIILGAYYYLTGGGDPENVSKANRQVLFAVVAVVVATFSKVIPVAVSNFIGTSTPTGC